MFSLPQERQSLLLPLWYLALLPLSACLSLCVLLPLPLPFLQLHEEAVFSGTKQYIITIAITQIMYLKMNTNMTS